MRLMISQLKGMSTLLFPLVFGGGMLQIYNLEAAGRMVSDAIVLPTPAQLVMPAMIYPFLLIPFFRVDGSKLLFQVATTILVSALLGILVFPALSVLLDAVLGQFDASVPWFNLLVLVLDAVAAFGFLITLRETDMHKMPKMLIYASLFVLEGCVTAFIVYNSGVWIPSYNFAAAKLGFAPYSTAHKPAQASPGHSGSLSGQQVEALGKSAAASLSDVARAALNGNGAGQNANTVAAVNTASTLAVRVALTKVIATPSFTDPTALAQAVRAGKTDADREAIATVVANLRVADK
jgi:hypothetical protein